MRRFFIGLVLTVLLFPSLQAQYPQYKTPQQLKAEAEAAAGDLHHEEVSVLEHENARAWQLGSSSFFARVYGDDYIGTNENGQTITKAALIRAVQTSDVKYKSVVASDIHVRFYQDIAVVQTLWSMLGTRNGQTFSRQMRVIHVYADGPRGWTVIAGQQTALPG